MHPPPNPLPPLPSVLAISKMNSNAMAVLAFLHRLVTVFEEYFKELEVCFVCLCLLFCVCSRKRGLKPAFLSKRVGRREIETEQASIARGEHP